MSRVDVVIPCYNYARYLCQCVRSVLSQEGVDVRVLIIDDCSRDDSAAVGARLAAGDSRVEFRRHEVNRGHIATYNEGLLEWASGTYCQLLSADDLLTPGALHRAVSILDCHPSAGLVFGRDVFLYDDETPAELRPACGGRVIKGADYVEAACARANNLIPTPTVVTRTALQQQLGGYRPDLPHTGDMEMWLRFAAFSDIAQIDADQAYYRIHPACMHIEAFGTSIKEMRQRLAAFEAVFQAHADRLADVHRLRSLVSEKMCEDAVGEAYGAWINREFPEARALLELARSLNPGVRSLPLYRRLNWTLRTSPRLHLMIRQVLKGDSRAGGRAPRSTGGGFHDVFAAPSKSSQTC